MRNIAKALKSAFQMMANRRRIKRSLREIAREPNLSGPGQIPDHLDHLLRRQMLAELQQHPRHRKDEVIPMITMITRHKIGIAAAAVVIAAVAILAVFMIVDSEQMPTFAQLAQASEIAATKVNSLRMIGRDTERGKLQDYEIFIKNPFLIRKNFADGGYLIGTLDKTCMFDKEKNVFTVIQVDRRVRLQQMGLEPDTAATSMFTKASMMTIFRQDPKGPQLSETDIKIEEIELEGKPAYKVSFSIELGDCEFYFDKATGLVLKGYVETEEGRMGGEIVEVNPELAENLFSMKPPAGATVIDKTLDTSKGE